MLDTLEIRDFLSERQSHATLGRCLCEGFMSSGKMCVTHPLSPESISIESKERNLPVSKHLEMLRLSQVRETFGASFGITV